MASILSVGILFESDDHLTLQFLEPKLIKVEFAWEGEKKTKSRVAYI